MAALSTLSLSLSSSSSLLNVARVKVARYLSQSRRKFKSRWSSEGCIYCCSCVSSRDIGRDCTYRGVSSASSSSPPPPPPNTASIDSNYSSSSSSSSSSSRVTISIDPSIGCAHVVLNRPDKLNALDLPMFEAIAQAAVSLQTERGLRSVIVSGQGRAFCTGLDVKSSFLPPKSNPWKTTQRLLQRPSGYTTHDDKNNSATPAAARQDDSHHETTTTMDNKKESDQHNMQDGSLAKERGGDEEVGDELLQQQREQHPQQEQVPPLPLPAVGNLAQDVAYLWRALPVPVIAVLHGMCFGGGLQIALGADVRYATPDCQLSIMETKWGLVPDMSASITLRELVRIDVAKELTMTGRIVLGPEAATLGLITKCVDDPMAHAQSTAQLISTRSPHAVAAAKHLYQSTYPQYYQHHHQQQQQHEQQQQHSTRNTMASEQECLELETTLQKQLLGSWNQIVASARNFGIQLPYRQLRVPTQQVVAPNNKDSSNRNE